MKRRNNGALWVLFAASLFVLMVRRVAGARRDVISMWVWLAAAATEFLLFFLERYWHHHRGE